MFDFRRNLLFLIMILCNVSLYPTFAAKGRLFSSDHELVSSMINHLYQDRYGYVWIATENGINRYDGNHFVCYQTPDSIYNQYVSTINEDRIGNLWIGTIVGLERLDRESERFVSVPIYKDQVMQNVFVSSILQRKNGELWAATSQTGIAVADSANINQISIDNQLSQSIYSSHINVLFEDNDEKVWVGTETEGLFFCTSRHLPLVPVYTISGERIFNISSICSDKSGNLFVGTLDNGVYVKYAASDYFQSLTNTMKSNECHLVKTIEWNENTNSIMIGTDGNGVFYYKIGMATPERMILNGLPTNINQLKIHDFLLDQNDNVWIGMYQKGVLFIPHDNEEISYIGPNVPQTNIIGSSSVMTLAFNQDKHLWVGTDNDGLYELIPDTTARRFSVKEVAHFSTNQHASQTQIPRVIMDMAFYGHQLWLASYNQGLVRFNTQSHLFQSVSLGPNVTKRLSSIQYIPDKWLWITTYGSGTFRYNLKTDEVTQVESIPGSLNVWATCIAISKEALWLGTSMGLHRIDKPESAKVFSTSVEFFKHEVINTILCDSDTLLWVGTRNGLYRYNVNTGRAKHYTVKDGLSNNIICGLQQDKLGNLWISTQKGLSFFNYERNSWAVFNASDGLQGNEFIRQSCCADLSGNLFWGGINGISFFNPLNLEMHNEETLNLLLTSLKVNSKIQTHIIDTKSFVFSYSDRNLEFSFSTFDFSSLTHTRYKYRIKKLSNQWLNTELGQNEITLSNLSPGEYDFDVFAVNDHGSSDVHTYHLIVTPPWYLTWWACCIWVFLISLSILTVIKHRISRMHMKQSLLQATHDEEVKEAKLETYANISHDIKTPMSLIMAPLGKLQQTDPSNNSLYQMMYRNGRRIIKLIDQLLDVQTLDEGQFDIEFSSVDIVHLVEKISLDFTYEAQRKTINFTFKAPEHELMVWTDSSAVEKILLNLLSNAFKFTPDGGEIAIEIGYHDSMIFISVSDTGIGMEKHDIKRIFDRFYRTNLSRSSEMSGNGIGLNLSLALAKLLHGDLIAEQRTKHDGTRFVLTIPIGESHLQDNDLQGSHRSQSEKELVNIDLLTPDVISLIDEVSLAEKKAEVKTSILIVDDDEDMRSYLSQELSTRYAIFLAENGLKALNIAVRERPTLILSDIMMPRMNGIQLCKRIKQNIILNDTPFVLLTAKVKPEDRIEGLKYGADAYIEKPFNIDVLLATIANLIQKKRSLEIAAVREENKLKQIEKREVDSPDDLLIKRVNSIINKELANADFNVSMLAESVGISRVHLNRKLTKLVNQTTSDYIRSIRIEQALELLAKGNKSISEVAYAVGYNSLSHFSNVFKQIHGQSPREYQDSVK